MHRFHRFTAIRRPTIALAAAACILLTVACSNDDGGGTGPGDPPPPGVWSWVHPLPQGNTLHGLDGISPFDQWVVGERGFVGRYRGLDLGLHSYPVDVALKDVYNPAASNVFAVGDGGTALKLNGDVFEPESTPTLSNLNAMWGSSDKNIIAVGDGGTVLQRSGGAWNGVSLPTFTEDLHDIWGLAATADIRAVGDNGMVLRFNGSNWSTAPAFTSSDLYGVWASKPGDWFAVGENGEIWQDRGAGWTAMASPTGDDLYAIFGNDSAFVFAMGATDSVYFYDQIRWSSCTSTVVCMSNPVPALHGGWGTLCGAAPFAGAAAVHCPPDYFIGAGGFMGDYGTELLAITDARTFRRLNSVAASASGDIVIVGDAGTVVRYDGTTVGIPVHPIPQDLNRVWFTAPGHFFVAADRGRILHSTDAVNWEVQSSSSTTDLYGLWGTGGSSVWVVGDLGTVRQYDGTIWQPRSAPTEDYRGVWGTGEGNVFLVGLGGVIARDDGTSITLQTSRVSADLFAIWGTGASNIVAVGAAGTIVRFDGADWRPVPSPTPLDILDVGPDGLGGLVAVVADGSLLRARGGAWVRETTVSANPLHAVLGQGGALLAVGETGTIISYGPR